MQNLSARQNRIIERLARLVGEGPAAFYKDACLIMSESSTYLSTTHLVSHLLRDLESALRDVLEPLPNTIEIENGQEGESNHALEIKKILKFLNIEEGDSVAQKWLNLSGKTTNKLKLHSRAHRESLKEPRKVDEDFLNFWNDMEEILFLVLEKFEMNFSKVVQFMDELLVVEKPTKKNIDSFKEKVPYNTKCYSYFFRNLQNPLWLEKLFEYGFFNNPPEPYTNELGQLTVRAYWPQSTALINIAKIAPELVSEIILKIKTDNEFIHTDFCNAALSLPVEFAVKIANKESVWLHKQGALSQLPHHYVESLGKLIEYLGTNDEIESSINLAYEVFKILEESPYSSSDYHYYNQVKTFGPRFEIFNYWRILNGYLPKILAKAPKQIIQLYSDFLNDAISYSKLEENEEILTKSDFWRLAIGKTDFDSHYTELKNCLVSALRDGTETIIQEQLLNGHELINSLLQQEQPIFKRIALYLLLEYDQFEAIVENTLNSELMFNGECKREFLQLLKKYFHKLSLKIQESIIDGIRDFRTNNEEQERHKYRLLYQIQDFLKDDLTSLFESYKVKFGDYDGADIIQPRAWIVDSISPRSKGELDEMTIDEIINLFGEWEPKHQINISENGKFQQENKEALAGNLKNSVEESPSRYAIHIDKFKSSEPLYLSSLFAGFSEAASKRKMFTWEPLINFCIQLSENSSLLENKENHILAYIDSLLGNGLSHNLIPFTSRKKVWQLVNNIYQNLVNEIETHEKSPFEDDYYLSAINSSIGRAYEIVIEYSFWVSINLKSSQVKPNFSLNVEAEEILNQYINSPTLHSEYAHAILGRGFYFLTVIDTEWTEDNFDKIFSESQYGQAAWDAYIHYCGCMVDYYNKFSEHYKRTISRLSDYANKQFSYGILEKIIHHLTYLYLFAKIDLISRDNLLFIFFDSAGDSLRAQFISFIANGLIKREDVNSIEKLDRLKKLWEWRINTIEVEKDKSLFNKELNAFVDWFATDKLDWEWKFKQLARVLTLIENFETTSEYELLGELLPIASKCPEDVLVIIELLVNHPNRSHSLWNEKIHELFAEILNSENNHMLITKVTLISQILCSYGDFSFKKYIMPN